MHKYMEVNMLTRSVLHSTNNNLIRNSLQSASAKYLGKNLKILNESSVKIPKNSFSFFGNNENVLPNKTYTSFDQIKGKKGKVKVGRVICLTQLKKLILDGKIEFTDIGSQPNKPNKNKLLGGNQKNLGSAEKDLLQDIQVNGVEDKKGLYLLTDIFLQNIRISNRYQDAMSHGTEKELALTVGSVMQKPNILIEFHVSLDENVVLKEKGNNSCVIIGTTNGIQLSQDDLQHIKFSDTKTLKQLSIDKVKRMVSIPNETSLNSNSNIQLNTSSRPQQKGMFGEMFNISFN